MRRRDAADRGAVALVPLDDAVLEDLLAVAVRDADPEDTMPPVPGPPGWTTERRDAFRRYHRARYPGLGADEATYAVTDATGRVAGAARLRRVEGRPGAVETGIWLGRSYRGRGVGTAALSALVATAARTGATVLVADTTAGNAGALAALRRNGAALRPDPASDRVDAELRLPAPPPQEPRPQSRDTGRPRPDGVAGGSPA
ncbi:GNAT family N-acetyltransferase [Nocardiopsis trehalosi]|uniref:GNAT family N-acetyltransferase n=1 Tax=Nocardiopsis trehalosi TaxID=109329 RepID=UPI000A05BFB1|nr:GNAT family N-acetyltransferase [Nocardiopsis trehalosi]